jgi:hypothetical protein
MSSLAACSDAPSQVILGCYFPSWMICALIGTAAAVALRLLLVADGFDRFQTAYDSVLGHAPS